MSYADVDQLRFYYDRFSTEAEMRGPGRAGDVRRQDRHAHRHAQSDSSEPVRQAPCGRIGPTSRLSDHVAVHGHQPDEVLLARQQLGLEPKPEMRLPARLTKRILSSGRVHRRSS